MPSHIIIHILKKNLLKYVSYVYYFVTLHYIPTLLKILIGYSRLFLGT